MITVLMAAWQGKKYLEQQLDSILAQTVPVRIWVSDDGSDDGTRELLEQYCEWYPKQVFLHSRENSGENGAAGNFFWLLSLAAKEGKSDYVMLLSLIHILLAWLLPFIGLMRKKLEIRHLQLLHRLPAPISFLTA